MKVNTESKAYKLIVGKEDVSEKKVETRFNKLENKFRIAYTNAKENLYNAEEVVTSMVEDSIFTDEVTFDIDDYVEAKLWGIKNAKEEVDFLAAEYKELFGVEIE